MLTARQLWFTGPRRVEIREQALSPPGDDEVLVRSRCSAISAGTEMLVYRGQIPAEMALDASLDALRQQGTAYPLQYGYATVGDIEQVGSQVDRDWLGRTVFAFQPHASHFITRPSGLVEVPDDIDPRAAVFLANMETAVTLVHDGRPALGEQAVVLGLGTVGQLVVELLAGFPLQALLGVDRIERRRSLARASGAGAVFPPDAPAAPGALMETLCRHAPGDGADLVYELSGAPEALNLALEVCGYTGRVVVGSWYGTKAAPVDLGRGFHRNRISLVSSQVSTIAPALTGRWDKARRYAAAWEMIRRHRPERLVSHRLPFASAPEAYRLLDEAPEDILQAVFEHRA